MPKFPCLVVAAVMALVVDCQFAPGANEETITVDLRSFVFKVREEIASLFGYDDGESRLFYYTGGAGEAQLKLPADGDYEIVIRAADDPALNERAKFKMLLDDQPVGAETLLTSDDPTDYKLLATGAKAGERKLTVEFTNDAYKEGEYDRNFFVHGVKVKRVK